MSTQITKPKKKSNKVSVWTAVFNFLMAVWVFWLPFIGIRDLNRVSAPNSWYIMYQTTLFATLVGIVCFVRILIALLRRTVQTPETLQAEIPKNRRSRIISCVFLGWAIYCTVLVAMAVEF